MTGTKISSLGIAILIPSLLCLMAFLTNITTNSLFSVLGGGGTVVGMGLFFLGFLGSVGKELGTGKGVNSANSGIFTSALLRSMLAVSIADNHLDDDEVSEIMRVYKHLTKDEISEEVVRATAEEMMGKGTQIFEELKLSAKMLNKDVKEKIIIACLYILAADGDMDPEEEVMLEAIQFSLNLSAGKVRKIKADFVKSKGLG